MQYLSLEESKEVIIKFLKHFDGYNKEKAEEYFRPKPRLSFFKWFYKFLTHSLPKRMLLYDFFPQGLDDTLEKFYKESLSTSLITFEDEEKCDKLYEALKKTIKENNLSLFYAIPTSSNQAVLLKDIIEGIEKVHACWFVVYIFPNDFSFLLYLDDDAIVIYSSQKIISDFKKNYPDWQKDFFRL